MRRLLSALLILVLAVSHAPMSAAILHAGAAPDHGLTDHHDDEHVADHDASDVAQAIESGSDSAKAPATLGHHHHVVGDAVAAAAADLAPVRSRSVPLRPADDDVLAPAGLTSISEPPIA